MADLPVPYLRAGDTILNTDGTIQEWFRNAWNALVQRTGTETSNTILGVINGQQEALESIAAVNQRAVQAQATANSATAGVNTLIVEVATGGGSGLYATVSPTTAYGSELAPASITSNSVTVTPTGGVAPYTYAWTLAAGTTITVNSPTAATTSFTSIGDVPPWTAYADTATCTVTDSTGGTPLTTQVSLNVTLYGTSNEFPV